MTETLSHIAMRRINGPDRSQYYTPLPGVSLSQDADGCLVIDAPALHDGKLVTNDVIEPNPPSPFGEERGERREEKGTGVRLFKILGRKDNVICSGGIKIQIEEVERLLRPHLHIPFIITRERDEKFGEVVVLLVEKELPPSGERLMDICRRVLPKYWVPRRIVVVDRIPLTETGKPARAEAQSLLW